jgi:hypothetical protein
MTRVALFRRSAAARVTHDADRAVATAAERDAVA